MNKEVMVVESNVSVLGQSFNIYGDFENPLFLAKDVATWIEHADVTTMVRVLDEEEKLIRSISGAGQSREMLLITEDGLYEVLMLSRKPIAKLFKAEVKKLLKGLRTKKLAVVETVVPFDNETLLLQFMENTKKLIEDKRQLEAQVKKAIREKGQISNEREASVMGKLGAATKKINVLVDTVQELEEEIKELKSEPDNTIIGFSILHNLKLTKSDLSLYGRALTKICKGKGIDLKTIQMEGEKYPAHVYPVDELVKYFVSLGFVL